MKDRGLKLKMRFLVLTIVAICLTSSATIVQARTPTSSRRGYVVHAGQLRTYWNAWPSGLSKKQSSEVVAKWADSKNNYFNENTDGYKTHTKSYASAGMMGGYVQWADVTFDDSGDPGVAVWLGTYYHNWQQAAAYFGNAQKSAGANKNACPKGYPSNCFQTSWTYRDNNSNEIIVNYQTWAKSNVVAEAAVIGYLGPPPISVSRILTQTKVASAGADAIKRAIGH